MKFIIGSLLTLIIASLPAWAQEKTSPTDIVTKMQADLNLTPEQVYNITPIVEKYAAEFSELQRSIDDGTINPSAIDSQRQQLQAAEDQDMSQYLTPNEISQWNYIRSQSQEQADKDGSDNNADADIYSNLPRDISAQN
jgi:hypothetical protein